IFPRWTVQTLMQSGMILSEENRSGELGIGIGSRDWDNDGVPWLGKGHGKWGTAPTLGELVYVNIGAPGGNQEFNEIDGEMHSAERWGGDIRYNYHPRPRQEAVEKLMLPVKIDYEAMVEDQEWVEREDLLRWDGTIAPLPPAKFFKRGSELKGEQIFQMNCAHCHGYTGEGITGIPFDSDSLARTRDDMFEVPHNGRFTRLMPEWGLGNQDEMESVLTDDEIYRIVDHIQSDYFKKTFIATQNGIVSPDHPIKDPYFYISRSYIRGKEHAASEEDIALVMNAQREAIETGKPVHVIKRLISADRAGGAQGEIARATGWIPENFKVLAYTSDMGYKLAQAPLEFPDVALASAEEPVLEEADLDSGS
ncbi:MAG: c-type cytochrome, partial [Nitrospinales bacterium]